MIAPPIYFEAIRKRSADRWDQLERDKELAAPWHQLFKQIQSPRHVVSELLQNADDAGATSAKVELANDSFTFRHDGSDFEEQHFASLCRFGYSNKRSLHTIGFRGIGFKSTFSLGDEVRVLTPSLKVAFHRNRFTEPVWLESESPHNGSTTFTVAIQDTYRHEEIEKNLASWLDSPTSLLFFRSLRSLFVDGSEVTWQSIGEGPVPNSEWLSLSGSDDSSVLLIRSDAEVFPPDAIDEIRQERMMDDSDGCDLPPCTIEIVLGLEGRLFVVLPTGVKTSLPFACNGPFIQDPARLKIKDPETSPTNRWLLERCGRLAASAMLQWLRRTDLALEERAKAYQLLVITGKFDDSLEGSCGAIVAASYHGTIGEVPFLLTDSGDLKPSGECLAVPNWLPQVWSPDQISKLFDDRLRPILARVIDSAARSTLASCGYLPALDTGGVLQVLRDQHLPCPDTWNNLLELWDAVAEKLTARRETWQATWKDVCIVPVEGQNCLHPGPDVARLSEKRQLQSDNDWEFLVEHLLIMDPDWTRFIAEQRRAAESEQDSELMQKVHSVEAILQAIGLNVSSSVSQTIDLVSQSLLSDESTTNDEWIRLARVAAVFDAKLSDRFQFIARDGMRISCAQNAPVLADLDNDLDSFVPGDWCQRHALHNEYSSQSSSCTNAEWRQWVEGGRSGLLTFVRPTKRQWTAFRDTEIEAFLRERGHEGAIRLPYTTWSRFVVDDWDFLPEHWQYWESFAEVDDQFWGRLFSRVSNQPAQIWQDTLSAAASQIATNGWEKEIPSRDLISAWILKLRSRRCLQDTWGNYREPAELLRRTPATEALLDVEPFVRAELDTEAMRPLLEALGVRDTPTGTASLLKRLKALATVPNPPFFEVEKWCHRLDSVAAKCTTNELANLKEAFHAESLVFTTENTWARASEVFLSANEAIPGALLVHEKLRNLTLWQRIEVKERPTLELVIEWLRELPTDKKLPPDDVRRVREILPRYPAEVWDECGCWLNLEGEWVSIERLRYHISMQSLATTRNLFPSIREQVADLQFLPKQVVNQPPFSNLPTLASVLSERVQMDLETASPPRAVPWMIALGNCIAGVVFDDADKSARMQQLGRRLGATHWLTLSPLRAVPYIDGTPAGTGRTADAVWDGPLLYVDDRPMAKVLRSIVQELSRPFADEDDDLADTVRLCVERSPEFIRDYLSQNFTLQSVDDGERESSGCTEEFQSTSQDDWSGPRATTESPVETDYYGQNEVAPPTDDDFRANQGTSELIGDDTNAERPPASIETVMASPRPEVSLGPAQPRLIARYARLLGYRQDGSESRYYHTDGSWIQRSHGQVFPWDVYSPDGDLVRSLWVREHCLEQNPLELPREVWELCQQNPQSYALVITAPDGTPREIPGKRLQEMLEEGRIELFPATYRIVYQHGR